MFSLSSFKDAEKRIREFVDPSPIIKSNWLSQELGAEVYLKLECFHPGRSFKIRGATNAVLSQKTLPKKIITASGGNHGLGVAIAAKRMGIPSLVVLPTSTSTYRVNLLKDLGSEILLLGDAWDESNHHALTLASEDEILYIHAFADDEVIQGQGTIALELHEQLGDFDILVASIGGGGLLTGISLGIEALGLTSSTSIIGVETIGAECYHRSREAEKIIELPSITSIAKTLGARKTTEFNFITLNKFVDKSYIVSDRDAVKAINLFLENEKILVEPAMSCIVSAVLEHKSQFRGKKIVLIVCGSNVTLEELQHWNSEFEI